ncbi:hypothetical protein E9229_001099 [Paeniglutamicibacter cryotolerans]|uniref:Uncharacterized protein n=1 Tax=Paeniglutamicibacter cryotolerans TaxID=670079 RepID=A0A839QF61_9MICC|nr:hypothetical protein [Paeniglutamicibacter cryotolerans]
MTDISIRQALAITTTGEVEMKTAGFRTAKPAGFPGGLCRLKGDSPLPPRAACW